MRREENKLTKIVSGVMRRISGEERRHGAICVVFAMENVRECVLNDAKCYAEKLDAELASVRELFTIRLMCNQIRTQRRHSALWR